MLRILTDEEVKKITPDDPVRPHKPAVWRTICDRKVYGLFNEEEKLRSVICVGFTHIIPKSEMELEGEIAHNPTIAVFYTVWSYDKGAGREIVFKAVDEIKQTHPTIKRFVTLSPITDMAKRFHERNGAKLIDVNEWAKCQNFEYFV